MTGRTLRIDASNVGMAWFDSDTTGDRMERVMPGLKNRNNGPRRVKSNTSDAYDTTFGITATKHCIGR